MTTPEITHLRAALLSIYTWSREVVAVTHGKEAAAWQSIADMAWQGLEHGPKDTAPERRRLTWRERWTGWTSL